MCLIVPLAGGHYRRKAVSNANANANLRNLPSTHRPPYEQLATGNFRRVWACLVRPVARWHNPIVIRPRTVVIVMIVGLGIATTTGCASEPAPTHDWSARMIALLSDPGGQGGAGGDLRVDKGAKSARGTAELASVPTGEYDVLAVCTGAGIVHIAIESASSSGRVLASSDIACGATLRLPVSLPMTGIVLEATSTSTSAQWQATVVTPGWEPTTTTYSP